MFPSAVESKVEQYLKKNCCAPRRCSQASAASEETDGKAPGGRFEAERRFEHVSSDERWFRAILGGQSYGLVDWGLG